MEVAVLGTGPGGRTVTRQCVAAGCTVRLYAEDANAAMDAVDAVERSLADAGTDRLTGTTGLAGAVENADVVVDTTDGDAQARRELVAEVETSIADDTLVATGDTTVSVTAVAAGLRTPGRAFGLNIVDDGELAEVVVADQTTAATRDRATEFVDDIGCTPIVVADTAGFATARLELAAIAEAIRMAEAGVASVPDIDSAAVRGREDRGPLARADAMGLDTVLSGLEELTARIGDRFRPPALLEQAVAEGRLGRQTGAGFYVWTDGEPTEATDLAPAGPSVAEDHEHR